jgi:hypothetical protein
MDGHHPHPILVVVRAAGEDEAIEAHSLHRAAGGSDVAALLRPAQHYRESR